MDDKVRLIPAQHGHQHNHHDRCPHQDRRRKRHIFVFLVFLLLIFISFVIILASSFGFKQRNSLLHNNEIINSSIVINIIINGKNENKTNPPTEAFETTPATTAEEFYPTEAPDVEPPEIEDLQKMDRYIRPLMPQPKAKDSDYQEIGGGRLKINDGYRRPMIMQTTTSDQVFE